MNDPRKAIVRSAVAGVVASVAMGLFAMVASATYQDTGFFTPLYHIASLVLPPDTMMESAMAASEGTTFTFDAGPALVGLLIHMMVGAGYGAAFGALLTLVPASSSGVRLVAGVVYGAGVFALSSFVLLPLLSNIARDADAIRNMAEMVGYPTFLAEHLLFGLVLGALGGDTTARTAPRSERSRAHA